MEEQLVDIRSVIGEAEGVFAADPASSQDLAGYPRNVLYLHRAFLSAFRFISAAGVT